MVVIVKTRYFRLPGIAWIILIVSCVYCMTGTACFPNYLRAENWGPLGHFSMFLQENNLNRSVPLLITVVAFTFHVCEALYCWRLCRAKGIEESARAKWVISTLCFGGCSVYELVRYQPTVAEE